MKENVGRIDRIARSIIGPGLMMLGYTRLEGRQGKTGGLIAMIAGALLVESAITRVCPINAALRLDTRTETERQRDFEEREERALEEEWRIEPAQLPETTLH